ncbi:MAG: hypothetical protein FJX74_06945 [Armatimonadetes bacterium]|nr:hypothetical protein [Armatimonadota bacterium]
MAPSDLPEPIRPLPYTDEELLAPGPPRTYRGAQLNEIAFPLGGIGAGCISLSGRGALVDWEIFNRPNKGYRPGYTFLTLFAQAEGQEPVFRVLEGQLPPPYQGLLHGPLEFAGMGFGPARETGAGLLRFEECRFTGAFPTAQVALHDGAVPVAARIEAWSPFIPLNDRDSSMPVAVLEVTLENTRDRPVHAVVGFSLENVCGHPELGGCVNRLVREEGHGGLLMSTEKHQPDSPRFGTLALLTPHPDTTWELSRGPGHWFALSEDLLFGFGETGRFPEQERMEPSPDGQGAIGSLGLIADLAPGESRTLTFVLAWHFPNFEQYWEAGGCACGPATWPNYYAALWPDAHAVAREVIDRYGELRARTFRFREELFASTLPAHVVDAVSSQLAILRTPTVARLPDGTLYGWEGCHAKAGCCPGSCTHVWNYAQSLAHVFPALERGMRDLDFALNLRESDGHMQFRMDLPPGTRASHGFHAAADGQMGNVLRTYREWQISGDDAWLKRLWPSAKQALEHAWEDWDADRDGLLEGVHHNTLDIEYHGPETVCGSLYLAALRAGENMARHLGDEVSAREYRRVFESGRQLTDQTLFNGEFYFQRVTDEAPYQFGEGCIIDQVIGQWYARMLGLGDLLDPEHVRSALAAVFRHNFRDDFRSHHNPHRVYALGDDGGLLICTWPRGGRPARPLTYAYECMIGFEYQVGAHLIYEGFVREGLTVCKAVRDRHDGLKRNPWNEFECGSHYARSMANYAFVLALSGFRYSAVEQRLELAPQVSPNDFRCFFSVDSGWGSIRLQRAGEAATLTIAPVEGVLRLRELSVDGVRITLPASAVASPEAPLVVALPG